MTNRGNTYFDIHLTIKFEKHIKRLRNAEVWCCILQQVSRSSWIRWLPMACSQKWLQLPTGRHNRTGALQYVQPSEQEYKLQGKWKGNRAGTAREERERRAHAYITHTIKFVPKECSLCQDCRTGRERLKAPTTFSPPGQKCNKQGEIRRTHLGAEALLDGPVTGLVVAERDPDGACNGDCVKRTLRVFCDPYTVRLSHSLG